MSEELDNRELKQRVVDAGYKLGVNQAGPLLEQMSERGEVTVWRETGLHKVIYNQRGEENYGEDPSLMRALMKATFTRNV